MQKKRDLVSSLIKIFFILCSLQLVLLESKSALDVLTKSTFVGYDNPIFLDVTRFHQDIMGSSYRKIAAVSRWAAAVSAW